MALECNEKIGRNEKLSCEIELIFLHRIMRSQEKKFCDST
jgi:hypothetical protein